MKTRLVPTLGEAGAARLAHALLCDLWSSIRTLEWAVPVLATTGPFPAALRPAADVLVWRQGHGDLGQRIERILARALRRFSFAMALGADTPALPQQFLMAARAALDTADAAIGPTDDGGFYLLALRTCPRGLLDDLPWSGADTCARTTDRLRSRGLSSTLLPQWFDVDRAEDLQRLRELLDRDEVVAPATRRALGWPWP